LEKFNRGDTSKGTSGEEAIARFGLLGNGKGKGKAEDVLYVPFSLFLRSARDTELTLMVGMKMIKNERNGW